MRIIFNGLSRKEAEDTGIMDGVREVITNSDLTNAMKQGVGIAFNEQRDERLFGSGPVDPHIELKHDFFEDTSASNIAKSLKNLFGFRVVTDMMRVF
ncbi:MAG: hypothetical protein UY41_C0028G0004 [Candidatus Moranbacteria bacterium GW2011_GWE1_49_15]|nr:MAG: hypothetical protein UX75_C0028G0015 [Candidatus Moranbacteria bacterium GW2011_GWE2_47_10]KKW06353.1 MAG: hypothetical protein UY41_C0028G0004 [Candidatus Moranbacteria bacterium GW2011_GWE1_49_15]HBP01517.1 hypothetical protein [Candidatus Moranbacteria bacterium]